MVNLSKPAWVANTYNIVILPAGPCPDDGLSATIVKGVNRWHSPVHHDRHGHLYWHRHALCWVKTPCPIISRILRKAEEQLAWRMRWWCSPTPVWGIILWPFCEDQEQEWFWPGCADSFSPLSSHPYLSWVFTLPWRWITSDTAPCLGGVDLLSLIAPLSRSMEITSIVPKFK